MPSFTLTVNNSRHTVEVDPSTPLLWVLRDTLGLTGTKYGCGQGYCSACLVHTDGQPTHSCSTSIKEAEGKNIVTIEGFTSDEKNPLVRAWIEEEVSQCGYCQPGQIMSAAALLARNPNPSDADIDAAMAGNLCRCGTYMRIRRAIHRAATEGGVK
jgi:aerobic-type carbon monoxide dehydrogenase small subunit (CoxS/CutS family)